MFVGWLVGVVVANIIMRTADTRRERVQDTLMATSRAGLINSPFVCVIAIGKVRVSGWLNDIGLKVVLPINGHPASDAQDCARGDYARHRISPVHCEVNCNGSTRGGKHRENYTLDQRLPQL